MRGQGSAGTSLLIQTHHYWPSSSCLAETNSTTGFQGHGKQGVIVKHRRGINVLSLVEFPLPRQALIGGAESMCTRLLHHPAWEGGNQHESLDNNDRKHKLWGQLEVRSGSSITAAVKRRFPERKAAEQAGEHTPAWLLTLYLPKDKQQHHPLTSHISTRILASSWRPLPAAHTGSCCPGRRARLPACFVYSLQPCSKKILIISLKQMSPSTRPGCVYWAEHCKSRGRNCIFVEVVLWGNA